MYVEQKPNGRWMARYRDEHGKWRSAGVFDAKKEAEEAALYAELGAGTATSQQIAATGTGVLTLRKYFYSTWVPNATQHPRTVVGYETLYRVHIDSILGTKDVRQITQSEVRRALRSIAGTGSPHLASRSKAVLGAVYRTLIEEDIVEENPTRGVTVKSPDAKPFRPLEKEEFALILEKLKTDELRFFAKFLITTGMRYGEASEVRVYDYNDSRREILLTRSATLMPKRQENGSRIVVKEATKSGFNRVIPVSKAFDEALRDFISTHQLGYENLLFGRETMFPEIRVVRERTSPGDVFKDGNRTYRHGTTYAYNEGKCRCELCTEARMVYKRRYTYVNRDPQKFPPMEHMDYHSWKKAWNEAAQDAGLSWRPRTHDLRHSNATALLSGKVDIFEVMQRLGHRNLTTTQKYLHRMRESQERAAEIGDQFL